MITLDQALSTGRGVERAFNCPVHDDRNASASVNTVKQVWFCYACGAHGSVEDHVPTTDDVLRVLQGDAPPVIYPESWLDLFDAYEPSPYWTKRYGADTANHFRCGTDFQDGSPTYPIRNARGQALGVVRRYDSQPKYRYPANIRVSETLFGLGKRTSVVVLVEGAADVMALHQSGIPDNWTALGVFGAGLHFPQVQILADWSPKVVIAAFDDDPAGHHATERAQSQLADIAPVVSVGWATFGGKDPGEVPVPQRVSGIRATLQATTYRKYA